MSLMKIDASSLSLKECEELVAFNGTNVRLLAPKVWLVWHSRIVPVRYVFSFADFSDTDYNRKTLWAGFGQSHSDAYIDFLGKMGQV